MKAISRWLDRFCYNHPNFGIPNLMKYIALGNALIFVGDLFSYGGFSWMLRFYPERILHGEVWRLISFIFAPVNTGGSNLFTRLLFFAMTTMFYYWIGTALSGMGLHPLHCLLRTGRSAESGHWAGHVCNPSRDGGPSGRYVL